MTSTIVNFSRLIFDLNQPSYKQTCLFFPSQINKTDKNQTPNAVIGCDEDNITLIKCVKIAPYELIFSPYRRKTVNIGKHKESLH